MLAIINQKFTDTFQKLPIPKPPITNPKLPTLDPPDLPLSHSSGTIIIATVQPKAKLTHTNTLSPLYLDYQNNLDKIAKQGKMSIITPVLYNILKKGFF